MNNEERIEYTVEYHIKVKDVKEWIKLKMIDEHFPNKTKTKFRYYYIDSEDKREHDKNEARKMSIRSHIISVTVRTFEWVKDEYGNYTKLKEIEKVTFKNGKES